ncbi:hypothetical protein [Ruegeria atlantica]|uniref:hypothetical protein n=1 Tax=Ruegeria atlantica TaxID=81569 RepID=UPI00147A7F2E|nr:hypothetical protein [Ruegeria atlantica]
MGAIHSLYKHLSLITQGLAERVFQASFQAMHAPHLMHSVEYLDTISKLKNTIHLGSLHPLCPRVDHPGLGRRGSAFLNLNVFFTFCFELRTDIKQLVAGGSKVRMAAVRQIGSNDRSERFNLHRVFACAEGSETAHARHSKPGGK